MIPLDTLRTLYDYNYWARDRQLEACRWLAPEDFNRELGGSFPSVRETLEHLLLVEWIWHERWQGRAVHARPEWASFASLAELRERWLAVENDVRAFLAGLNEAALAEPLTYANLQGKTCTYPLWQMLLHVANHQSYHRGQVTEKLRRLAAQPVPVDFLDYIDGR